MYDVLDVCRYIIGYSNEKGYGVSNLKLQKLLYLVQAWFLVTEKYPCFAAVLAAWDFGPVVPEVYRVYASFGSCDISFPDRTEESRIREKDRKRINQVVDRFADYAASDLTELAMHQLPWMEARTNGTTISSESIRQYFAAIR